MKKFVVISVMMAAILFVGVVFSTPAYAQAPASSDTPTFYRLVPGTYVNGWPRFTITYPKDWVERRTQMHLAFKVSALGPVAFPSFGYAPGPGSQPIDRIAEKVASFFKSWAQNVTIISDKPTQLRDGTPAREFELHMLLNGAPHSMMGLAARKGDVLVNMGVESSHDRIGQDLKTILYSIEFQPEKDTPVKVPPDVQELLDRHCKASVAHDFTQLMANYSDRYLNSGERKVEKERSSRQMMGPVTSLEMVVTDYVPVGDRAYLTGFGVFNFGTWQFTDTSIIKENGEWKWYGNQRDVAP